MTPVREVAKQLAIDTHGNRWLARVPGASTRAFPSRPVPTQERTSADLRNKPNRSVPREPRIGLGGSR